MKTHPVKQIQHSKGIQEEGKRNIASAFTRYGKITPRKQHNKYWTATGKPRHF